MPRHTGGDIRTSKPLMSIHCSTTSATDDPRAGRSTLSGDRDALVSDQARALPGSDARDRERLTVIEPPGRWPRLGLTEAWDSRGICLVLASRSIKVRYRQSIVGIGWVVLQPLLLAVVFTAFFSILARPGDVPFPVFFLSGLFVWQFAAKVLGDGTNSVVANATLVNRVYFPRILYPVSVVLAALFDLIFTALALLVVMALYGLSPAPTVIVAPLLVVIAAATMLGAAALLASLSPAYRDVTVLLPVLTQLWFFATPVLYSADAVVGTEWETLYYLNPMALVVSGIRWAILGLEGPPTQAWITGIGVALGLLVVGYLVFRHREPGFSDVV
jgi:lipopolysaccharide transport system permease protein